ncbi:DUF4817 domain-containing protein [Trichonephila clavipes]|nr:DUF4817 domain-containing protein [Trichonephila clavipes]
MSDHPELLMQLALEVIDGMPLDAVKIYTDGSNGETNTTGRYRTLNCNKTTMYYSIDMNFFYSKDNLVALHFKYDQARRRFVEWAQNEIAVVLDFHKRILFSDEAHFWLNGYVNKQNCRIWSEANPQVYVETPLHTEKLTVWCALWAGGILLQKR